MKEEALKLAYEMDNIEFFDNPNSDPYEWACDAQKMIFKLVEELDALNAKESMWQEMIEDLECQVIKYKQGEPFHDFNTLTLDTGEKRSLKPLSDEKIKEVWFALEKEIGTCIHYGLKLARAIEKEHGIK